MARQSTHADSAPVVSVILPAYNRLTYLRASIDCVFAQTFTDWELVIADDGSGAETAAFLEAVAQRPRVRVLRLPHSGNPSAVRNAALREARGQYIAFLDSDDVWRPEKLDVQVKALRSDSSYRWSYTEVARIGPAGEPIVDASARIHASCQAPAFEHILTLETPIATPAVMVERRLLEEVGGFDEQQLHFEEYDLWLRLIQLSPVAVIAEPLCLVRSHVEHYTSDRVAVYEARARLLDKVAAVVESTSRLQTAVRSERAKNAVWLAKAYAHQHLRARALRTLWSSRHSIWERRYPLWRSVGLVLAYVLTPAWLYTLVRYCRRQRFLVMGRA